MRETGGPVPRCGRTQAQGAGRSPQPPRPRLWRMARGQAQTQRLTVGSRKCVEPVVGMATP